MEKSTYIWQLHLVFTGTQLKLLLLEAFLGKGEESITKAMGGYSKKYEWYSAYAIPVIV